MNGLVGEGSGFNQKGKASIQPCCRPPGPTHRFMRRTVGQWQNATSKWFGEDLKMWLAAGASKNSLFKGARLMFWYLAPLPMKAEQGLSEPDTPSRAFLNCRFSLRRSGYPMGLLKQHHCNGVVLSAIQIRVVCPTPHGALC